MRTKSLTKNYIYNMFYQVLAILAPMLTTPYISRILNADGLGVYSYTYSIATYFVLFGKMGMDTYGQLAVAECKNDRSKMSKTFFGIFWSRSLSMLIWTILYVAMILLNGKYRSMYIALFIYIFSQFFDISWFYQGIEEFGLIAARNSFIKMISTILIFATVKLKSDLILYVLIVQGSVFFGNITLWFGLKKYIITESGCIICSATDIMRHIKNNIIYFIPSIATSVYSMLDKSMIGWITKSEFENGYYEQAHKIESIVITVITSLSTVTLPRLKYLFSIKDKEAAYGIIKKTLSIVILLSCPMFVGLLILAPYIIPWFLGEGYQKCIILLQIFSLLMIIVGLDNIIGKQCLMATGKQKEYNIGVTSGAVVNVIANLFLIKKFLSVGAAVASVLSEIVILFIFIYYSKEYLDIRRLLMDLFKYFSASLFMGVVVCFCAIHINNITLRIVFSSIVGVIVYMTILFLCKDKLLMNLMRQFIGKMKRH